MRPYSALNPLPSPLAPACARKTAWRWAAWLAWVLCLSAASPLVAQGKFNAKNSSTTPVIGPDGVTRMSKVVGRVEIVYKGTVLSTAKNTFAADGIFSLGILTVPDVGAGGTATITVRVWDVTSGATYASASTTGEVTFDISGLVTEPPSFPALADFFPGLALCSGGVFASNGGATVEEGGAPLTFDLSAVHPYTCCNSTLSGQSASVLTNLFPGSLRFGTLSGVLPILIYAPPAHVYGYDGFTYPVGPGRCYPYSFAITISPSPERSRPALAAAASADKVVPKLRGLNGHRYRVERSADLMAWGLAGEVTGNFSEVDLSPFIAPDDQAQFFRASDLTPQ